MFNFWVVIAVIVGLLIGPWITIVALNTLFSLNIEVTIWTWLAAFWLNAVATGNSIRSH